MRSTANRLWAAGLSCHIFLAVLLPPGDSQLTYSSNWGHPGHGRTGYTVKRDVTKERGRLFLRRSTAQGEDQWLLFETAGRQPPHKKKPKPMSFSYEGELLAIHIAPSQEVKKE